VKGTNMSNHLILAFALAAVYFYGMWRILKGEQP
jgi:hypothetical protein